MKNISDMLSKAAMNGVAGQLADTARKVLAREVIYRLALQDIASGNLLADEAERRARRALHEAQQV